MDSDEEFLISSSVFELFFTKKSAIHDNNKNRRKRGEFYMLYDELRKHPGKFRNYTRMSTETFDYILGKIENILNKCWTSFNKTPILPCEKLILTLRMRHAKALFQLDMKSKIRPFPVFYKTLSLFWKNYHNIVVSEFLQLPNVDEGEFNVLNHGDCCITNIMFQYDDGGKLCETYLVDNQLPLYGTPAFDLIYFLFSSAQRDIKLKYFDHFIKYYHDNLVRHLKLLKYPNKLPSLRELHVSLIKYGGCIGYTSVVNVMGAVLLPPSDDAHFTKFIAKGDEAYRFRKLMYSNEKFRSNAEALLPWLHNRGALEVCK